MVAGWKWLLGAFFVVGAAFCAGTETALTALGEARARQVRDGGGRRARMLSLWIDHPERVLTASRYGYLYESHDRGKSWVKLRREFSEISSVVWVPD